MLCSATLLPAVAQEKILFLNEGQWQTDNGRLSYFENGSIVSNQYFRDANGWKLGDTPNNIIQIDDNRLAIAVNWGNIVQFTDIKGKAITATEDVPNNRYMVSDGISMSPPMPTMLWSTAPRAAMSAVLWRKSTLIPTA